VTPDTDSLDLYCLYCGYNLRGLSTDPRRCPECGHENAVADMLVPAKQIKKALTRLETAPAMATGAVVVALVWLLPISIGMARSGNNSTFVWRLIIASLIVCLAMYIVGVRRFRASCSADSSWETAMLKHHFFGLLAAVCITVLVGMCCYLLIAIIMSVGSSTPVISAVQMGLCGVVGAVSFAGSWLFGRLAKRSIAPLQRARAAEMARAYARQREH